MSFEEFMRVFGNRLNSYARRYWKQLGAPRDFLEDLQQVAQLTAFRKLSDWQPNGGRNPFNFVAPSVRAEMWYEWRKRQGYKPYAEGAMDSSFVPLAPDSAIDSSYANAEAICDMRREFSNHPRPSHLVRFIMAALSPASAAELGRAQGLTRQCVSSHVRGVRRELREALG